MQVHSSSLNLFNRKDGAGDQVKSSSQSRMGGGGVMHSKSTYTFGTDSTSSLALFDHDWSRESLDKFFSPVETFLEGQLRREKSSRRRCGEIVRLRNIKNYNNMVKNKLRDFDEKINLNLLLKMNKKFVKKPPPGSSNPLASESQNFRMLIAQDLAKKSTCCDRCNEKNKKYEEKSMNAFNSLFESLLAMNHEPEERSELDTKIEDVATRSRTRLAPVTRLLDKRNKITNTTSSSNLLTSTSSIKSDLKLPKLVDTTTRRGSRHMELYEHSHYGQFESKTLNEFGETYTKKSVNQMGNLMQESVVSMASSIDESILSDRSDRPIQTNRRTNNNVISRSLLKQRANIK